MTCDRCGRKKLYPDGPYNGIDNAHIDGWTKQFDKDLCPDCTVDYDNLIADFFAYVGKE